MAGMFIEPIQRIDSLASLNSVSKTSSTGAGELFKNIFEDRIREVVETDTAVASDVQAIATGETDDLHTLGIDQTKAQLSISLLVQMRNRFMESYNELMRINL